MKALISSIVVIVMLGLGIYAALHYQDKNFAAQYFSFMTFDSVLDSKKWHGSALGCTYAIVSVDNTAPTTPPKQWLDQAAWFQTPMRFKEQTVKQCRNLICHCETDLNTAQYQALSRALSEKGSFYFVGGREPPHDPLSQGTVLIYSPVNRVAASVRFGD